MSVCIFLTVRIGSSRLPQKALLEANGETVTEILIKRLKKCNLPIIICTTDTPEDRKYLKPLVDKYELGYHEAPEGNIIKQHLNACNEFNVDYVILSEIDDWLVCPETINAVHYQAKYLKYKTAVKTTGLPYGMNVISYPKANLEAATFTGSTGWGIYVTENAFVLKFNYNRPYSLSMDCLHDAILMKNVYQNCKRNLLVGGICDYLEKHPEVAEMNSCYDEEYWKNIKEG